MLGSNDRSVLRGGIGPRHQVKISGSFEITKYPIPSIIAKQMIESGEAELASESEWAVSKAQNLIRAAPGTTEPLADSVGNYWGTPAMEGPTLEIAK